MESYQLSFKSVLIKSKIPYFWNCSNITQWQLTAAGSFCCELSTGTEESNSTDRPFMSWSLKMSSRSPVLHGWWPLLLTITIHTHCYAHTTLHTLQNHPSLKIFWAMFQYYCYRQNSVVCVLVWLNWFKCCSLYTDLCGPKEPSVNWGSRSPTERGTILLKGMTSRFPMHNVKHKDVVYWYHDYAPKSKSPTLCINVRIIN